MVYVLIVSINGVCLNQDGENQGDPSFFLCFSAARTGHFSKMPRFSHVKLGMMIQQKSFFCSMERTNEIAVLA